jgi:hypothetical protein
MSLSSDAKRRLEVALASKSAGDEVAAAVDSQGSGPAAVVAALGTTADIPGAACAGAATPTATQVNAAIDTVAAVAESRLDAIEIKIDAILGALKTANLMASS